MVRDDLGQRVSTAAPAPTDYPIGIPAHSVSHVPSALMIAAHAAGGMPYERSTKVEGDLADLWAAIPSDARLLCSQRTGRVIVADVDGARFKIESNHGKTEIQVVGADELTVDSVVVRVTSTARELIKPPPPSKVRMAM